MTDNIAKQPRTNKYLRQALYHFFFGLSGSVPSVRGLISNISGGIRIHSRTV
jgi:hypothetical protein